MKKGNKSYRSIVQNAHELFDKFGIKRVSIEEICKTADVSKMTFYRNFANKLDLVNVVLDEFHEDGMRAYRKIMQSKKPFDQKIKELIELKNKMSSRISNELLKDIYQNEDLGLKEKFEAFRKKDLEELMQDLKKAQTEGWIRKEFKLEFIIAMIGMLHQQMADENFRNIFSSPQDASNELVTFFFHGIMSNSHHS